MNISLTVGILVFLLAALLGGVLARLLKLEALVGYILAGIVLAIFLPPHFFEAEKLSELGAILLLFSVGLELSFSRLRRIWKVAVWGGLMQIILTTSVLFIFLLAVFNFSGLVALILAIAFSLSSTAVVVKLLTEKGELETIHGELMTGWLLIQDLAVVPIMILLPILTNGGGSWPVSFLISSGKAILVIGLVIIFGRVFVPFAVHKVASLNSRELLLLTAFIFALGTAVLVSLFGFSAPLGAFLAGLVIAETREKYAVFVEIRPLKNLFAALFFTSLGVGLSPIVLWNKLPLIILLVLLVFAVKFVVFLLVNFAFGYHGRAAVLSSLNLMQVGEFSFIIFSQSLSFGLLSAEEASLASAVVMVSLLLTPLIFRYSPLIWRRMKLVFGKNPLFSKFFVGFEGRLNFKEEQLSGHVIICGFGRVGKWVAKALNLFGVDFVVIDYNEKAFDEATSMGIKAIYGDASDSDIIKEVNVKESRCVVIAIPDRTAQEELVTQIQTLSPRVKIFARAHFDSDAARLRFLRVNKVVQPEFEAALVIIRAVLIALGKNDFEVKEKIASLKRSHTALANPSFSD